MREWLPVIDVDWCVLGFISWEANKNDEMIFIAQSRPAIDDAPLCVAGDPTVLAHVHHHVRMRRFGYWCHGKHPGNALFYVVLLDPRDKKHLGDIAHFREPVMTPAGAPLHNKHG